jgi:hypothetical protein
MADHQLNEAADYSFVALHVLALMTHGTLAVMTKNSTFWIGVTLGCAVEFAGYIGRTILSYDENGFLIQICCLTLAPAFITAAIHSTLGDIVTAVSLRSSRIKPTSYSAIFLPCDITSLTLQGTGVGMVSMAIEKVMIPQWVCISWLRA